MSDGQTVPSSNLGLRDAPGPREPIAIVGIGCRLPGGAVDPGSLWSFLERGGDGITGVPGDRWDWRRFFDANPQQPGKTYTRHGGFLRDSIWDFDARFFAISPREASILDPQQRLALEVAWEAIEDAGLSLELPVRERTGVYMGAFTFDNAFEQAGVHSRDAMSTSTATSHTSVMISNRIAHAFDLRGPAMTVDTACSSSLVATHLGCQALWSGDCDVSLVGGVNVMLRPEFGIAGSKGGFLSPSGRCRAFDAGADGYVRGEGAGVVVLKTLARAQADGDAIYAVLLGTGVNQDGRTPGVTVPSPDAQRRLIEEVCARAGVAPGAVQYVEAHGPGTQVGDPIEAAALGATLGAQRGEGRELLVGSIKTNVGHLEAAAGVAGLIKAALTLAHRRVVPNLHFVTPNPKIDFVGLGLRVPTIETPLPESGPVYAAVNSFGYGGTNAHAILGTAPRVEGPEVRAEDGPVRRVFPISARDPEALRARAAQVAVQLREGTTLAALGHTLGARRVRLEHRLGAVGSAPLELAEVLEAFARGEVPAACVEGRATSARRVAFLYPGMGAQFVGMGRELHLREPIFRAAIAQCDAAFARHGGWSLARFFAGEDAPGEPGSPITEPRWAQPANLAMQVGLTRLLEAYGLVPGAVVGHSVGEVAAAWAAGALSLDDAFLLTAVRSRLQQRLAGAGGMLVAAVTPLEAILLADKAGLSVAALNSPSSVTFAGTEAGLEALAQLLEPQGTFHRRVRVAVAYHSSQMDPLEAECREAFARIEAAPPAIPMFSTVLGAELTTAPDADHWWRNVRAPVSLRAAIGNMARAGFEAFLEVGPRAALSASVEECLAAEKISGAVVSTSLARVAEPDAVARAVASLTAAGVDVDWTRTYPQRAHVRSPCYPWQRRKLWTRTEASTRDLFTDELHPLVHQRLRGPQVAFETELSASFLPYLQDHVVDGVPIYPAACHLIALLTIADQLGSGRRIEDLVFERALAVSSPMRLHYAVEPRGESVEIFGRPSATEAPWTEHTRARFSDAPRGAGEHVDVAAVRRRLSDGPAADDFYAALAASGLAYGPSFRVVRALHLGEGELLGELACDPSVAGEVARFGLHPTMLDGCLHALLALRGKRGRGKTYVPVRVAEVRPAGTLGERALVYGRITQESGSSFTADVDLLDPEGVVLLALRGVQFGLVAEREVSVETYAPAWDARPHSAELRKRSTRWLIISDGDPLAPALVEALSARGGPDACIAGAEVSAVPADVSDVLFLPALAASAEADEDGLSRAQALAARLGALLRSVAEEAPALLRKITVVTRGAVSVGGGLDLIAPEQAPLIGLARVGTLELSSITCVSFDLDPEAPVEDAAPALIDEILALTQEDQVALRKGARLVSRLRPTSAITPSRAPRGGADGPFLVEIAASGQVEHRALVRRAPGPGEVEVSVEQAELVERARSRAPSVGSVASAPSGEMRALAGRVVAVGEDVARLRVGDAVMAFAAGTLATHVTLPAARVVGRPAAWSPGESLWLLERAAARHALDGLARVRTGERILVLDAGRGVGLAVALLASRRGLEVHGTVHHPSARLRLEALGVRALWEAGSLAFAQALRTEARASGFDVLVACSASGVTGAVEALAPGGRLVLLGPGDFAGALGPRVLTRDLVLCRADVERMAREQPDKVRGLIEAVLESDGGPAALPIARLPLDHLSTPRRELSDEGAAEKQVIALEGAQVAALPARRPAPRIRADRTYLVTGGLGGLGLEIAEWLVAEGARHLALLGRRAPDAAAEEKIQVLEASGARVKVASVDVADRSALASVLHALGQELPPLAGVVHAAGVLDDCTLGQLDPERLDRVMRPKVVGAHNLHVLTLGLELELFVMCSSIAAVLGNAGQASYVAANLYLDALAEHRAARNLAAISIGYGPIQGTGMVQQTPGLEARLERLGLEALAPESCSRAIGRFLREGLVSASFGPVRWSRWRLLNRPGLPSRFEEVSPRVGGGERGPGRGLREGILHVSEKERVETIRALVVEEIAKVTGLAPSSVDLEVSPGAMGIDSLMALELVHALRRRLEIELSTLVLMQSRSVGHLAEVLLTRVVQAANDDASARVAS